LQVQPVLRGILVKLDQPVYRVAKVQQALQVQLVHLVLQVQQDRLVQPAHKELSV
jgi:hypothetical protein